jgi:hypothetical protein
MVSFDSLAVIFLNSINLFSFVMEKETGFCSSEAQLLNTI